MKLVTPGSPEAIKAGCKCPVLDNSHGKGWMGVEGVYVYNSNCPFHKVQFKKAEEEIDRKLKKEDL